MAPSLPTSLQDQLGARYRIERELGRGGMGTVYLARDRQLDRPVALKVLPSDVAGDDALRERFLRETRLVASFSHPNIVPVFAVEEAPGLLAFAMGYVEGDALSTRVARSGPLSTRETVRLLQDIGYALAYAHGRGIVHRDLKPDNIMIERATGRALLMDFGIARTIDAPTDRQGLTRVGEVVGTPEFMSPEQAVAETVDGRSDLYALGLVAYFALTGTLAISGETTQRVLVAQLTQPVPSVSLARPDVPAALAAVIERCAAKEPEARFATAEAMVEALDAGQLAAPDVALPIRELGDELDIVPVVLALGVIVAGLLLALNQARNWAFMDGLTSMSIAVAVVVARLAQVRGIRRRLTVLGFDGAAVHAGLTQLYDERAAYRDALRQQPGHARRRWLRPAAGLVCLLLAPGLANIGYDSRTQLGPNFWFMPWWGRTLVIASNVAFGVAIVLIVYGVLAPVWSRLMPRFWLGPVGRWLLGTHSPPAAVAVSTSGSAVRPVVITAPTPAPQRPPPPGAAPPDVEALRAAVQTLDAHVRSLQTPREP